jgi:DNA-directed RNA polymerase specialized sigma24 family protein
MSSTFALHTPASSGDVSASGTGLSHVAFSRLLEWLDDGVDSQGQTYVEMRRRLVSYFDRRDRNASDELADETLNRIGKTLERDTIAVRPPARYCYVVARFVFLEDVRRERVYRNNYSSRTDVDGWADPVAFDNEDASTRELRLQDLGRCLAKLAAGQRALVVEYYRDSGRQQIEHRREMAARLDITMNALAIRAHRARAALEACMEASCGHP